MAMRRKGCGRDLALTVRMAVASSVLAGLYLAALAVPVLMAAYRLLEVRYALLLIALGVVLLFAHYASLDALALRAAGARVVDRDEAPELHAALERLAALADVPTPRLAVIDSDVPNAFAAGRNPARSTVAVTYGLLHELEPAEVEAVLAHELAHIANRDGAVMTFAAFPALTLRGALASAPLRVWIFGLPFMLLGCALYGLALGLMLVVSRCREYAADRGAVLITGAPGALMSALQKIAGSIARIPDADLRAVERMSAFFVVPTKLRSLTHPPLERRLERLSELARELGAADPPISLPVEAAGGRARVLEAVVAFALAFPLFVGLALLAVR